MADLDRAIAALRDWNSRRGQISGSLASLRKHDAEGAKHARTILAALDAARGEAVAVVNRHMLETLVPNRWIPVVAPSEERSDTDVLLFAAPPAAPRVERYGDGVLVHWPEGMEQYVCVGDCVTGNLGSMAVPEGMALVPVEPTEAMLNAARDWSLKKYGQAVGNDGARGCYAAMLAAANKENGND